MKPTLQIRQSQQLVLTPQLQQAIRLLQLSTLDLQQEIEQALARNPLLERIDDPWDRRISLGPDGNLRHPATGAADAAWQPDMPGGNSLDTPADHHPDSTGLPASGHETPIETYPADEPAGADGALWEFEGHAGPARRDDFDDSDRDSTRMLAQEPSLHEHLITQLAGTLCSPQQRELVRLLIEETEDDGYLRTPLDELLANMPAGLGLTLGDLEDALRILQGFDPGGVGARSVNECLSLQLTDRDADSPLPAEPLALARRIIEQDFLPMLASARDQDRLARLLHCGDAVLQQAIALIRSLNPKPGNRFSAEPPQYAIPDVFVRKTSQGWRAWLNRSEIPQLRVNQEYESLLKAQSQSAAAPEDSRRAAASTEAPLHEAPAPEVLAPTALDRHDMPMAPMDGPVTAGDSLSRQLQEARQMIRHVEQRSDTILRVAQAIVDRQQAFFKHGPVAMRPLVLREIAEALDLHESTISRATRQKYMRTPFGTVELKYFFGSHVATDTGGAASSTAICAQIEQLIREEDSTQPLSDNQITELLGQQGIKVARRTVAKYRESLRILPAAQRKTR